MDWNLRPSSSSSSLWEWDNFFDLDNPKRLHQQPQSQVQHSFESLHSPAGSGSDLGSKSSLSACESKTSNTSTNPNHHHHHHHQNSKLTFGGSTSSPGGEPLLSLKLGKRMYFKTPSPSAATSSSVLAGAGKRSKSGGGCRTGQAPRCQVEGCGLDLSEAKDYHKKHRICESHSKSPRVVVNGIERRFCQQCSRFHGLSEFDEKKRSCRRRLSDHNARRRKPQPDPVRLNPVRFTTSLYDGTQKMSLYASQGSRFSWGLGSNEDNSSKFGLTREYFSRPCSKTISAVGSEIPGNLPMLYPHLGSTRPIASKVTAPEFLQPEESNETHDLHRALSLLSTSCWGSNSREGKPVVSSQANNNTNNNIDVASSHGLVVPFGSSEVWLNEQPTTLIATDQPPPPVTVSQMIPRGNGGNANTHFHDLHLFKPPPTESGYYSYQF